MQVVIAQNYRPPYSIIRDAQEFGQRIMTFVILTRLDFQGNDFIIRFQYKINFSLLLAVEVVQIPSMSVKFLRDGENFDSEPYITLDGNYTAKKMIFNVYDAKTLYIAAENADEQSDMKASMFIYDISDDASAKLLFKDDKVGGTVKDLIYKGNGREYENIPSEKALSRLFR